MKLKPEHTNDPLVDMFLFPRTETETLQIFPAKDKKGEVLAYAWEQIAPDGYSGTIRILMGVRLTGEVFAIRITNHRETPGLGDGITNDMAWLNSFVDKTLGNAKWEVEKDGGDFDQFTGATITPRAVVKAVFNGLKMYQNSQSSLLKATQAKQDALNRLESEKQSAVKSTSGGKKP
jgi:electron transport complex protein RnfG